MITKRSHTFMMENMFVPVVAPSYFIISSFKIAGNQDRRKISD